MDLATFLDPTALALVGGGTLVATFLRSPARDFGRALIAPFALLRRPFAAAPIEAQIVALGRIAQRHGVMALDRSVIADADLAVGIAAIVDGALPEAVGETVRAARRARIERHAAAADVWAGAAEVAPAMGMVGTLVGLTQMFATMTDPATIGRAMAVALLATLYGALVSNLIAMPIANRLRIAARREAAGRLALEAPLVALAAREAPRRLGLVPGAASAAA